MNKILIISIMLFISAGASGQVIKGSENVNGGEKYTYKYVACALVQASAGVLCAINVANGTPNTKLSPLPNGGMLFAFDVTWDNIQGTGSVTVSNPECRSVSLTVNITKQNQNLPPTTVSGNITSNKNISGYNVLVNNADISNNATVTISAENQIKITPNTTFRNGTSVHLFLASSFVNRIKDMNGQDSELETTIYDTELSGNGSLCQNYPNPFKELSVISCNIPETVNSSHIDIYDIMGNLMKRIPVGLPGNNSIIINGSSFKPGVYSYSLIIDGSLIDTKRMVIDD